MADRVIAIGDIHGYSAALAALVAAIDPRPEDTVVTLGDYVDRGPDSRGVLDQLIALSERCRLVPLLGNHDEMLLDIVSLRLFLLRGWLSFGGDATLASYGSTNPKDIPEEHIAFLRNCVLWHESDGHFFVHASYAPRKPLKKQPAELLLWESIRDDPPRPHRSGKVAIVGHTSQKNGEILDLGHLKCIDTCVYGDGWLTALEVNSGQVWQADKDGRMRGVGDEG
ncbi:MAG: metallophosphoesterase [Planctomycetota bacterium]